MAPRTRPMTPAVETPSFRAAALAVSLASEPVLVPVLEPVALALASESEPELVPVEAVYIISISSHW